MWGILDEVVVPGRPDDPTLRFRHYRGAEDLPGMAAANQAMRDDAGLLDTSSSDDMAIQYANLTNSDLERDLVLVERVADEEAPSRTVGYARVEWRDLTDGTRAFACVVVVAPDARTPALARSLMGWAERRMGENAAALPDRDRVPSVMQAYTVGPDPTLPDVLRAAGWRERGRGYEMLIDPIGSVPAVPLPAGLRLRPIVDTESNRRDVWDALIDAFRDHRAEPEPSDEDWRMFRDEPKHDTALWVVAADGDEIVGGALGLIDEELIEHHGTPRGSIDAVFTRPAWRRRGVARATLAQAIERLRDRGMTSCFLDVDGLNPNQAMTLYESLGFVIASTSLDWEKPLPDLPPASDHG